MQESTLSLEKIQTFHNLNLDIKYTNELAASKTNDLVEYCLKELHAMQDRLNLADQALIEANGRIEEMGIIIAEQKSTILEAGVAIPEGLLSGVGY
jgi:hypothetical protein